MDKQKFILKRLLMTGVTLLLITVVVFIVIQLPPGDFVDTLVAQMISEGERVTQVEIDSLRAMYGVDQPMVVQYLKWLGGILTGDWGTSFYFNESVLAKIGETLGITMVLFTVDPGLYVSPVDPHCDLFGQASVHDRGLFFYSCRLCRPGTAELPVCDHSDVYLLCLDGKTDHGLSGGRHYGCGVFHGMV